MSPASEPGVDIALPGGCISKAVDCSYPEGRSGRGLFLASSVLQCPNASRNPGFAFKADLGGRGFLSGIAGCRITVIDLELECLGRDDAASSVSVVDPIFLYPRNPHIPTKVDRAIITKQAQNTARNPCINALGDSFSGIDDASVMMFDITARTAMPIEMPIWDIV